MALINHDALLKERQDLPVEERDEHYLQTEMIDPLIGGVIIGGFVDTACGFNVPLLRIKINDKVYQVLITADDEINDGGRLMIYPEMEETR